MRTLRHLSYAGTTTILTSIGLLAASCSGDGGGSGEAQDPAMMPPGASTVMNPDGSVTVTNPDGSMTTTNPDGTMVTNPPPGMTAEPGPGVNPGPGEEQPPVDPPPGLTPLCEPGIPATTQVPRLRNEHYDNIVRDLLGLETLASGAKPSTLLNADSTGPMDTFMWNAYQDAATQIAAEVVGGSLKSNFISCDPATVATCYEDTIKTFGRKAFRHKLSDEEVARFMTLTEIQPAGTPDEIAEALLHAFLVSPSFIMTPEMAGTPDASTGAIALSSDEVAMRLSLAIWGSVPDDDLNAAADADLLKDPAEILTQATRMLADRGKAGAQVAAAHRNYLVMDDNSHWFKMSHSFDPDYSDELRPTLKKELDLMFEELAYTGGSFKDLFTTTVGFVNQDTAALYGLNPADYGPELTKVDLPDRPGFLTRVGFLSSFASPEVTSPILRGAFITVNLIGVDPGAPTVDVTQIQPPAGDFSTRREQIEALTEPEECKTCHQRFVNPPGYALEGFDAVGKVQTVDPFGGPIDSKATVTVTPQLTVEVNTPADLMNAIANNPKSAQTYAQRLVAYATGRFPNPNDGCIVDDVTAKLVGVEGYTVLNLLADVTQAESFRLRVAGN